MEPYATPSTSRLGSDAEGVQSRDVAPDDQRVDIVGALVSIDRLEVHHVADDGMLVHDACGAQDVAGHAGAVEGHLDIVHLGHGDLLRPRLALVLELAEPQAQELRLGDLRDHPDQLLLDELEGGDGLAELDALLRIAQRPVIAGHGPADGAPRDAVAGLGETAEGALEALDSRELVLERDLA